MLLHLLRLNCVGEVIGRYYYTVTLSLRRPKERSLKQNDRQIQD